MAVSVKVAVGEAVCVVDALTVLVAVVVQDGVGEVVSVIELDGVVLMEAV